MESSGDVLDSNLTDAVKRFQRLHGLHDTGVVSKATIDALNVPVEARLRQIAMNLERWRWMPRKMAGSRVEVNIAAATLTAYKDDNSVLHMLAAAGKPVPDDMTPMLISKISRLRSIPLGLCQRI